MRKKNYGEQEIAMLLISYKCNNTQKFFLHLYSSCVVVGANCNVSQRGPLHVTALDRGHCTALTMYALHVTTFYSGHCTA